MSIVSVDNIQPIGSGTTVTVNKSVTLESGNTNITGVCTATSFSGSGANLTSLPAANLTGTLPAISGANLTGVLSDLVEDTSPQLAANLDVNGANILFGDSSAAGTNLNRLKFGAGTDLHIWHNSGTGNSNISNYNGNLYIQGNNGSGTGVNQIAILSNAAVELNYQGNKKLETTNTGATITGNLAFPSGNGIDFSASGNVGGMTSELLDDYEEGSFSPTLANGNNGYRFQQGTYTKIGNLVTFTAYIETSATPPSGNLVFGSLPFTSISGRSWVFPFHTNRTSFGTASFDARAYMGGNATTIIIYYPVNSSSSNFQPINQNGMNAANASAVWISGSYQTAS